jgi:hypothetical protein
MKRYVKSAKAKSLLENGQIILAHGEATGHSHQVLDACDIQDLAIPAADFFEEPDGRRVLLVNRPCVLRHQEHGPITLNPAKPVQLRQGDVLLNPIGDGAWEVVRQREFSPEDIRQVAD